MAGTAAARFDQSGETPYVSPAVVFAGDGVLVSRFIEGQILGAQDLRASRFAAPVVDLLRRCHHQLPLHLRGPVLTFWVFQVIRHYASFTLGYLVRLDAVAGDI